MKSLVLRPVWRLSPSMIGKLAGLAPFFMNPTKGVSKIGTIWLRSKIGVSRIRRSLLGEADKRWSCARSQDCHAPNRKCIPLHNFHDGQGPVLAQPRTFSLVG